MLQTASSGGQPDHYVDCYRGVDLLRLLGIHHSHLNAVQHVQFGNADDIYDDYVKVLVRTGSTIYCPVWPDGCRW